MSVLQNGKLPQFLPENVIGAVFDPDNMLQSLINLRKGLEKVGIFQVMNFIFCSVIYVNIYNPPPPNYSLLLTLRMGWVIAKVIPNSSNMWDNSSMWDNSNISSMWNNSSINVPMVWHFLRFSIIFWYLTAKWIVLYLCRCTVEYVHVGQYVQCEPHFLDLWWNAISKGNFQGQSDIFPYDEKTKRFVDTTLQSSWFE